MNAFEVPRRANTCSKKQEALKPGTTYYSVLSKEWERQDYCEKCFPGAEQLPEGTLGFWKAHIPEKKERPTTRLLRALELLQEAIAEEKEDLAFVLALFLARKKVLKLRQETEAQQLFEVLATEEMLTVKNVDLTQLEVDAIQKRIAGYLVDESQSA